MTQNSKPVFTRERILTSVLALLTLLAIYVCYRIVEPFVPPIAFALALAVATRRPYSALSARIHNRTAAAAIAIVLVTLLILGPAALLTTYIVQLAADNIGDLQSGTAWPQLRTTLESLPLVGPMLHDWFGRFRIEEQIANIGRALARQASGIFSGSVAVLTQIGITLFVLFFLYRDCGEALSALRKVLPLSSEEVDRMFDRVASTIEATVNGSLTVALIQAVLAGTVYLILSVPAAILWAALTFIMALVPVLGTFIVWAPIAAFLAITGSYGKAIFLVAWGALVVASVDNLVYPWLVGDKLRLHTVPTFFSVLGGIALFGPSGLILGPLALAITIGLMDVWWERTQYGQAAETALTPRPEDTAAPGAVLRDRASE